MADYNPQNVYCCHQLDGLKPKQGELLATETNERQFMTEGVRRIPLDLKEGRIRGVVFLPPGQGPFPGVLDVYTLGGGLTEIRASLLANKGFVVLALAYYGYQDLPRTLPKHFDLEYFEEAIAFLRQPQSLNESHRRKHPSERNNAHLSDAV